VCEGSQAVGARFAQSWISLEEAVLHYAADEVRWEMGQQVAVFRRGITDCP